MKIIQIRGKKTRYCLAFNTKRTYFTPDNRHIIIRLPKLLWKHL